MNTYEIRNIKCLLCDKDYRKDFFERNFVMKVTRIDDVKGFELFCLCNVTRAFVTRVNLSPKHVVTQGQLGQFD